MADHCLKTERVLVTGAAGFIGFHLASRLLAAGVAVHGLDNLNAYYDPGLKEARLAEIGSHPRFAFSRLDLTDYDAIAALFAEFRPDAVVHLAAQAGVRYSLVNPRAYASANVDGFLSVLEACRAHPVRHLIYASSSSVYGANSKVPYHEDDPVLAPVSLYAATKRANELMSHCYAHLYGIPQTGLRFFTVYGPWGRPDMALYIFTKAILAGQPLPVFNNGDMKRDFTYVDDIVAGVIAAADTPPSGGNGVPHRLYNIGNHRSEPLMRVIELLEKALGKKAQIRFEPMQPGDVKETFADISAIERDLGYAPTTTVDEGIPKFVAWYRQYHGV
jgi:UDP-glucuronate 4-epimerase